MGEHYDHVTLEDRCTIARFHEGGQSIRQIAATLDRSPSTVSRELKRNHGAQVGYKPAYAQQQASARRWKGSRLERDDDLRTLVLGCLERGWSPEQVAGWLGRQKAASAARSERMSACRLLATIVSSVCARSSKEQYGERRFDTDTQQRQTATEAAAAWYALDAARSQIASFDSQVATAKQALAGTRRDQAAGVRTLLDVRSMPSRN